MMERRHDGPLSAFFAVALCLGFVLVALAGCGTTQTGGQAAVGLIETKQGTYESRILLYDAELREVGSRSFDYASLGTNWNLSPVVADDLHVIPQGLGNQKNGKEALCIDLEDYSTTSYPIDRVNLYGVSGTPDYLYACSNLNGDSFITRVDKRSKETSEICLEDTYVTSIMVYDEHLYAFASGSPLPGSALDPDSSWLNVYDLDMNLISSVEITECGTGQYRPAAWKNHVLFTSWTDPRQTDGLPSRALGIYDVQADSLTVKEFDSAVLEALPYGDCVLLLFGDIHASTPTSAALFDPEESRLLDDPVDLGCSAHQRLIVDDDLYVLDSERTLRRFAIDDGFEQSEETSVSSMDGDYSYISGMFPAR